MRTHLAVLGTLALCLACSACYRSGNTDFPPIVGTWIVKAPEAPFPYHMFVFHADGTMQQSNPDAGDPNSSDSNGFGVWVKNGDAIKGKFVEVTADRASRRFASRGEISFVVKVNGNTLSGTASAIFYDAEGRRLRGPITSSVEGQRVMP